MKCQADPFCYLGMITALSLACSCAHVAMPTRNLNIANSPCDFLSPIGSRLTDPDSHLARQEAVVSATLLSRIPPRDSTAAAERLMMMIKQNPYAPEEAVYILRTAPRPTPPEFTVIHARAKESLLFKDVTDPAVGADFSEAPIDPRAIQALERAWGTMVVASRWPDRKAAIGRLKLGGTNYAFEYLGDNVYGQGSAVSPEPGSCEGSLAGLGSLLMRFADEPDPRKRDILRTAIVAQSNALTERLKP